MSITLPDELKFIQNGLSPQKESKTSLHNKVCVITGTTSGIGYVTSHRLALYGAHLVMIVRNREKGEKVRNEIIEKYHTKCDLLIADFSRFEDVHSVAKEINSTYKKIDILILNAGTFLQRKTFTNIGIEASFHINHLSPFLLISLLREKLIASSPSRVLTINSEGHRFSTLHIDDLGWKKHLYTGLKGYGAAKTAQLLTMQKFAIGFEGTGVTINSMHPGEVKSNIGNENSLLYRLYSKYLLSLFLKNPEISAKAIHYLVADEEVSGVSGKFFNLTIEEKPAKHATDPILMEKVWNKSIELTHL
ncbi:MAG: SDR family NAD(P)-dependent oxidoreductase [Spirochaetia bacterium]|nr:SDR family NAD(P)-dependent oxidoreductase [Spirochaetia bacterium]